MAPPSSKRAVSKGGPRQRDGSPTDDNDEAGNNNSSSPSDTPPSTTVSIVRTPSLPLALPSNEKLLRAYQLANEASYLFATQQYGEVHTTLRNRMTPELLRLLPEPVQLQCRVHLNLAYFYTFSYTGNLLFDRRIAEGKKDNEWIRPWTIQTLLLPETLATVTEILFAFALDYTAFDGFRKDLTEPSSLVENYLMLEPINVYGYDERRAEVWFSTLEAQGRARGVTADYRVAIYGPEVGASTHQLMEMLEPRLTVKMLYFALVRHIEILRSPWRTSQLYGCLRSYCSFNNYPFPKTLSLLDYRLFSGQTYYDIWWELSLQKATFLEHIDKYGLPVEFTAAAMQAFDVVREGDFAHAHSLLEVCDSILHTKEKGLARLEGSLMVEEDESKQAALFKRLLEAKSKFLHVYRDIGLVRVLFCLHLHEKKGSRVSLDPVFTSLQEALVIRDFVGPTPVPLSPLRPSLLLYFANTAMTMDKFGDATKILRHLQLSQKEPVVYHRLGDCLLRRFLNQSGESSQIVGEIADCLKGQAPGRVATGRETAPSGAKLDLALNCYWEARKQVRYLLESRPFDSEERQAMRQFREYVQAAYGNLEDGHQGEATRNNRMKSGKKQAKAGPREAFPEELYKDLLLSDSRARGDQNYSAMHQTFLEEMYIQTSLNIAYCFLCLRRYEEALAELAPMLANRGLSICTPYAVSQSAYLLACLYAGEAYYELGAGQQAAQWFAYTQILLQYCETLPQTEDPFPSWRRHLTRDTPLPYCTDRPTEREKKTTNLLESIFSYNYLTTLANMGRSERLPGRLARLRPNPIASKGSLSLYGNYSKLLAPRLTQLRASLAEGTLRRREGVPSQTWKGYLKEIKSAGQSLPEVIPTLLLPAKSRTSQPLTIEEMETLLMAVHYGGEVVNVDIPKDTVNPPVPSKDRSQYYGLLTESVSNTLLTLSDNQEKALYLTAEATSFYARRAYKEAFNLLDSEMTLELLNLLPKGLQIDVIMTHNCSYYATERIDSLLLGYLRNCIGNSWNVPNLLVPSTLARVAEHLYRLGVQIGLLAAEEDGNKSLGEAVALLEAFLWMDVSCIEGELQEESLQWRQAQAEGETSTWRTSIYEPTLGPIKCPLLEALHPTQACKLLYFLILTLNEKLHQPEFAGRLYGNLRSYLETFNYQIPEALSLLQYRLFTGTATFSTKWEIEIQRQAFLQAIQQDSELNDEFVAVALKAFSIWSQKGDYDGADRHLLECDRQLLSRKKDLNKFEVMVEKEGDQGLKASLGDRLIEAKGKYLAVYRGIRLNRALLALDRLQTEAQSADGNQPFDYLQEALIVGAVPSRSPYSATLPPLSSSILLHFANAAIAADNLLAAIDLLEQFLPAADGPLVYHRLGDCTLRRYLDLVGDDQQRAAQFTAWKSGQTAVGESPEDASNGELEQALRYYREAAKQVSAYLESDLSALKKEERKAIEGFTNYKASCLASSSSSLPSHESFRKKSSNEAAGSPSKGKAAGKKSKGKNGSKKKTKNASKGKRNEQMTSEQANGEIPHFNGEIPKVEAEEQLPVFGHLDADYLTMQRTFLQEMYVQLRLNIAYCCLLQRRYTQALYEVSSLLSPLPCSLVASCTISLANYQLASLYKGVAFFNRPNGQLDVGAFDSGAIAHQYVQDRLYREDPHEIWQSYLQNPVAADSPFPYSYFDKGLTPKSKKVLEGVCEYNLLTALAHVGAQERLPYSFALLRPNAIASKGTLSDWANYGKMLDYRWGQVKEALKKGSFNKPGDVPEASWKNLLNTIKHLDGNILPWCITKRLLQSKANSSEIAEQKDILLMGMFGCPRMSIPCDEDISEPEISIESEPAPIESEVKAREIPVETDKQADEAADKPAKSKQAEESLPEPLSDASSEQSDKEAEEEEAEALVVEELQCENRFANLQITQENGVKASEPEMSPIDEAVIEVGKVEESIQSETQQTEEVDAHSSFEFVEMEETAEEETPIEETPIEETPIEETPIEESPIEETKVQPDVMLESKWARMDEQLELGADDEERVDSEGSAIWDSVPQGQSTKGGKHSNWDTPSETQQLEMGFDAEETASLGGSARWGSDNQEEDWEEKDEEEIVEWDNPQETVESDTFFGLPQATLEPEFLTVQPDFPSTITPQSNLWAPPVELYHPPACKPLEPFCQTPAVKVSSTAKTQTAQAAANEIGNLLNKFKLGDSSKPLAVPLGPKLPPVPAFVPPALGLDELCATNRSLNEYLDTCPAVKAAKAAKGAISPTSLDPSNIMFDIGEFSPLPPANQCILDRYLSEQQQQQQHISDCASSKPPTPPPGGFPFGPIGPPPPPTPVFGEEEEEEGSSDTELFNHHLQELQKLLAKKKQKRSPKGSAAGLRQQQTPSPAFPGFPEWTQSTPDLSQGAFSFGPSAAANPSSPFSSGLTRWQNPPSPLSGAGAAFSGQPLNNPGFPASGPFPSPALGGLPFPLETPGPSSSSFFTRPNDAPFDAFRTASNSNLGASHFGASGRPANQMASSQTVFQSSVLGPGLGAANPLRPPPGMTQSTHAQQHNPTLASLFDSVLKQKPNHFGQL